MKKFLISVAATAFFATPIQAQNADWGGFFGGLFIASGEGTSDYFFGGVHSNGPWPMTGNLGGAFAGYNMQSGNVVYGGEIAYSAGELSYGSPPVLFYNSFLDLKGRVGIARNNMLFYAAAGISSFTESEPGFPDSPLVGAGFGLGVETQVTDRVVVGLEYYARTISQGDLTTAGWTLDGTANTLSARIALRF